MAASYVIFQAPPGGSPAILDSTRVFNTTLTAAPFTFKTEAEAKQFAQSFATNALPTFAIDKAALDAYVTAKGGTP